MPVATLRPPPPASSRGLCNHFLRNLTSLIVTSRLIGESLGGLSGEAARSPEIAKKISELIAAGREGESQLGKPMRDAGIILPAPSGGETAGRLVTYLYDGLPAEGASPSQISQTVINPRLLAQHLELRARLTAEEAKLIGEEPMRRVLLNWARQWWMAAQA
jgi:hypothetical protein